MMTRPENGAFSAEALEALARLYRELDRELEALGLTCRGCGICCHFDEVDHVLYASALEVAHLLAEDGPRPPVAPLRCPYQEDEACQARRGRPLGCRLHYCAATEAELAELDRISAAYHHKLKDLHHQHGIGWHYGPFLSQVTRMNNETDS